MGIFADFFATTTLLDITYPIEGSNRVIYKDLKYLEDFYGDVDYPAGLDGRPALAILLVTGVISEAPPAGQVAPLTISFDRGNNFNLPKEATIRLLAAEAAIQDNWADLEDAILDGVKYANLPHQAQTPKAVKAFTPCAFSTFGALSHHWQPANEYTLRTGDDVELLRDVTGGADMTPDSVAPTFVQNAFDTKPGVKFETPNDHLLTTGANNVALFPAKRGTVVMVFKPHAVPGASESKTLVDFRDGVSVVQQLIMEGSSQDARPLAWGTTPSGPKPLVAPTPNVLTAEQGYVVVVSRIGDAALQGYINGVKEYEASTDDEDANLLTGKLGFIAGGASSLSASFTCGLLACFNRVLTDGEVTTLSNELMACFGIGEFNARPTLSYNGSTTNQLIAAGIFNIGDIYYVPHDMVVADPDVTTETLRLTISRSGDYTDGNMWVHMPNYATAGVTFVAGTGVNDATETIIIEGTAAQITNVLEGISFQYGDTPQMFVHEYIKFEVSDLGNTGVGGPRLSNFVTFDCGDLMM